MSRVYCSLEPSPSTYLTIHPIPLLFLILIRNNRLPPRLSLLPLFLRKIHPIKRTRPAKP